MDKIKVYIESSAISYLTSRPTEDLIRKAKQFLTRSWWDLRDRFDMYVSETVLEEITEGDPAAAELRMAVVKDISILGYNEQVESLAQSLLRTGAVPANSEADAYHIAYAAVYGMEILLTWNQKHIATDARRRHIEIVIIDNRQRVPRLLTPEQHLLAMELENDNRH